MSIITYKNQDLMIKDEYLISEELKEIFNKAQKMLIKQVANGNVFGSWIQIKNSTKYVYHNEPANNGRQHYYNKQGRNKQWLGKMSDNKNAKTGMRAIIIASCISEHGKAIDVLINQLFKNIEEISGNSQYFSILESYPDHINHAVSNAAFGYEMVKGNIGESIVANAIARDYGVTYKGVNPSIVNNIDPAVQQILDCLQPAITKQEINAFFDAGNKAMIVQLGSPDYVDAVLIDAEGWQMIPEIQMNNPELFLIKHLNIVCLLK